MHRYINLLPARTYFRVRASRACVYRVCLGKKAKTKGKKPVAPKPKKDASGVAGLKPTVGTQFKDQLHNLMDMIRWVVYRAEK